MEEELSFKGYQKMVDNWVSQFDEGYFPPFRIMSKMAEELGEVARELNYHYKTQKRKPGDKVGSLQEELGDLLFSMACLANSHDIDLGSAARAAIEKFDKRDKNRYTLKEGSND